jgi:hypothetical protein
VNEQPKATGGASTTNLGIDFYHILLLNSIVNINVKVGRKALMMGSTLIAALVIAACGNDTEAETMSQQKYQVAGTSVEGSTENLWAKTAGEEIEPTGFAVDLDVEGPLYSPAPKAVDRFNAVGRVGTKCIAVFTEGIHGSNESLITVLYVEDNGAMTPWAARSGSEANVSGANRLIVHFKQQCT